MFVADKTQNLIVRLQYNVIRAGLRRINLAYSRISLADVATRLGEFSSASYSHSPVIAIPSSKLEEHDPMEAPVAHMDCQSFHACRVAAAISRCLLACRPGECGGY